MCYSIFVTPLLNILSLRRSWEENRDQSTWVRPNKVMFGFNLVITGPQVLIHIGIFTDVLMKPMKKPRHLTQSYSYNDILRYHQCCSKSSDKTNKNNDKLWCFMITWWQDQGWHVMITGRSFDSNCSLWQGTNELVLSTNDSLIPSTFYVYLTPSFLSLLYHEQKYLTMYQISILNIEHVL